MAKKKTSETLNLSEEQINVIVKAIHSKLGKMDLYYRSKLANNLKNGAGIKYFIQSVLKEV